MEVFLGHADGLQALLPRLTAAGGRRKRDGDEHDEGDLEAGEQPSEETVPVYEPRAQRRRSVVRGGRRSPQGRDVCDRRGERILEGIVGLGGATGP